MAEEKMIRLGQASRKLNVGHNTILEFLAKKGFAVENNPNTKLSPEQYAMLAKEYASSASEKLEASGLTIGTKHGDNVTIEREKEVAKKRVDEEESIMIKNLGSKDLKAKEEVKAEKVEREKPKLEGIKVLGKIELEQKPASKKEPEPEIPQPVAVKEKEEPVKEIPPVVQPPVKVKTIETPPPPLVVVEPSMEKLPEQELIKAKADKLKGLKVVDKIELPAEKEKKKEAPPATSADNKDDRKGKRPRKRITSADQPPQAQPGGGARPPRPQQGQPPRGKPQPRVQKEEPTEKQIQDQIKATLAKLSGGGKKSSGSKYRREKRQAFSDAQEQQMIKDEESSKTLKVTEFISANDMASLMDVSVNDVISTCLGLGMFVSINQRLDAEAITVIADEFGFAVQFTSEDDLAVQEETDKEEELEHRAPIVTIMGHVDHGKTSLLDYIRNTKVTASEAGGITQHVGAYDVTTKSGNKIAFLDTPGHEAFTAMRARGAKITDVAIIVVAADDDVMPQTKEAINHAQVAGVPIVIALNKVDKPTANPDKVRESLSKINILVEEWGGKYQCQEISAKTGKGIEDLLEKVLLEAELLNLKANPNKPATGSVIEATLDKGRGYVATIMVQNGTLKIGDILLAGPNYGRVKAMFDDTGKKIIEAGPRHQLSCLAWMGLHRLVKKLT
jgi:translation initiation factor IF-2